MLILSSLCDRNWYVDIKLVLCYKLGCWFFKLILIYKWVDCFMFVLIYMNLFWFDLCWKWAIDFELTSGKQIRWRSDYELINVNSRPIYFILCHLLEFCFDLMYVRDRSILLFWFIFDLFELEVGELILLELILSFFSDFIIDLIHIKNRFIGSIWYDFEL